jgi:transketolase
MEAKIPLLETLALYNRVNTLTTIYHSQRGWLGACYSIAELVTALYFDLAQVSALDAPDRDYVLLSKGHAAVMQYAALAGRSIISLDDLREHNRPTGPQAHTDISTPGIETNTGSLGQTLSKAAGLALGGAHRVFVILGDGELQEGQNWEAFMTIRHYGLNQVIPIIDRNGIQSDSNVSDIKSIPDLEQVLRGLGFEVIDFEGNDMQRVYDALQRACRAEAPVVLIANTRKAAGVRFMEADRTDRRGFIWHGKPPQTPHYLEALRELAGRPQAQPIAECMLQFIEMADKESATEAVEAAVETDRISTGTFFGQYLEQLGHRIPELRVLSADLEKSCKLTAFAQTHPDRFIEMGIAEQDMVSCAGGLALRGLLPVVNTYGSFMRRAFEQIYTNATEKTAIIYAGHYAGLCYSTDGKSHQCTGDIAMMRSIPGMQILYPAFNEQIPQMLEWYLAQPERKPVYIRLHRQPPERQVCLYTGAFKYGYGHPVRHSESRQAVLTCGPHTTQYCVAAADRLCEEGKNLDVWTIPTLDRLAPEFAQQLARQYDALYVIEENSQAGGLFDAVNGAFSELAEKETKAERPRIHHHAVDDFTFSTLDPFGLYEHFRMTAEHILTYLLKCIYCAVS